MSVARESEAAGAFRAGPAAGGLASVPLPADPLAASRLAGSPRRRKGTPSLAVIFPATFPRNQLISPESRKFSGIYFETNGSFWKRPRKESEAFGRKRKGMEIGPAAGPSSRARRGMRGYSIRLIVILPPCRTALSLFTSDVAFAKTLQGLARRHSSPRLIGVRPNPMAIAGPSGQ